MPELKHEPSLEDRVTVLENDFGCLTRTLNVVLDTLLDHAKKHKALEREESLESLEKRILKETNDR